MNDPTRATHPARALLATALILVSAPASAEAATLLWDAASGLLPDEIGVPYELVDEASPENPALAGGVLTLSTSQNAERMLYRQTVHEVPDLLVIEMSMRFVSGTSSGARRAAGLLFSPAPSEGSSFYIGADEIFLLEANNVKGPSVNVDTDDTFHTYRIEVDAVGDISVFYDDALVLSGAEFTDAVNGSAPRIVFGLVSISTFGTAEWEYVEHNAIPVLGASSPARLAVVLALLGIAIALRPALALGLEPDRAAAPRSGER